MEPRKKRNNTPVKSKAKKKKPVYIPSNDGAKRFL